MSSPAPVSIQLYRLQSDDLASFVDDRTFSRARNIFNNGGVSGMRAQGDQLFGRVRDRSARPYQVNVTLANDQLSAICTCHQGGICEHAAALLLAWTANRQAFSFTEPNQQLASFTGPAPDALWRARTGESRRMATLLASQRVTDLRKLAQHVSFEAQGETKETLAWRLAPQLAEKARVEQSLAQATPAQRQALQALVVFDRAASPADVERVVELAGGQSSSIDASLKGLSALGLAFTNSPGTPAAPGWQIPSDIAIFLPPGPLALADRSQHSLALNQRDLAFLTSLRALCLLLEAQPPPLRPAPARSQFERQNGALNGWHNLPDEVEQLRTRSVGIFINEPVYLTIAAPPLPVDDTTLGALAATLKRDETSVALMLRLLEQLKLLENRSGRLRLSSRISLLWERSAVEQARLLAASWANDLQWSEFQELPGVRLRRHLQSSYSARPQQVYADLAAMRRAVVRMVRALALEQSFSVESLTEGIRRISHRLLVGQHGSGHDQIWQLCDRRGAVLDIQESSDWRLSIVPFVQRVLRHMQILGLVTTDADVNAVQLTQLGAYLLGVQAEYVPQPSGAVLDVGADLLVQVAAADADATLIERLDSIAEEDRFADGSFRYRLTARTIRTALLHGDDSASIITFLQDHTPTQLPNRVVETITAWADTFGQVQIYQGVALLELADDMLLAELLRSTSLGSALVSQLSPRLVVVDLERSVSLWNELVAKGYTPHRVSITPV